mgnify:CR=1 FL=1
MRIIVLIKQVPDLRQGKFGFTKDGRIDRANLAKMMNPDDIHAVEAALSLKDQYGGKVITLCMGPPTANEILNDTLDIGVDETYLVSDRILGGADTLATAYTLFKAIQKIGKFDLIMGGLKAIDGETGQTLPQVAEFLHIESLGPIEKILSIDKSNKRLVVRSIFERGYMILDSHFPAVIAVAPTYYDPRDPTLINKINAKKKKAIILNSENINFDIKKVGLPGSPTKWISSLLNPTSGARKIKMIGQDISLDQFINKLKEEKIID